MGYTNSSLVNYTKLTNHHSGLRNHAIDTISIHCMAGNLSVETCGNVFISREASANYGVGSDGRIGMYVEEKNRSWCTSNGANDNRAITIEVANDGGAPDWHVSDKAMKSLIALCADICKRNNIKELKWQGDKSLIGQVDKQNMTVHRWFAAKACPGDYLYNKHGYIAEEVNKLLAPPKVDEWKHNDKGWWYEYADGTYPKDKWLKLDNNWYYFDEKGYAYCGKWLEYKNKWYYFDADRKMVTNYWLSYKDKWYYFNDKGEMVTGLQTIKGALYYFADNGHMCRTNDKGALV